MLLLVKAFLKAGILTELGENKETHTGTPQGGILSPLLANIALSVLDEHLHGSWQANGDMATSSSRARRRRKDLPNWRVVRITINVHRSCPTADRGQTAEQASESSQESPFRIRAAIVSGRCSATLRGRKQSSAP